MAKEEKVVVAQAAVYELAATYLEDIASSLREKRMSPIFWTMLDRAQACMKLIEITGQEC